MTTYIWPSTPGSGGLVTSINGLTGAVTLSAGSNITITPSGNTLIISASGGGGGSGFDIIGTFDTGVATTDGLNASGTTLFAQSADATNPGMVNTGAQSFAGDKTFVGHLLNSSLTANRAMITSTGGLFTTSATTATELAFVNGVTSSIQTQLNSKQASGNYIADLTGDVTASGPGSVAATLATVNGNVGSFGSSTSIPSVTVNAKGLITAASGNVVIAPAGTLTGTTLASNVVTSSLTALGTQSQSLNMGSNKIVSVTDPTSAQDAATKNYVDTSLAALNPADACYAATAGSNVAGTYLNGVSGVGATFTTTSTSTFTLDGTTPPLLSRILFKDQTSGFQNGVYSFTTAPVGGVSGAIFTRALDYNTASEMNSAGLIPIINGTLNALSSWQQVATITTVGTDALVFSEFTANPSLYLLKANNLSDVASKTTSFNNLSPMTTGGDIIYGGSSGAGTRLANGSSGQFLQSNGGTAAPSWGNVSITQTISAKTTTYAILTTDQVLTYSASGNYTTTLPSAVGIAGQSFTLIRTDNNTNIITVATTLSQTIGAFGTTVHLMTQGESWKFISDGANWQVQEHYCTTPWVNTLTWTPTTSFGTRTLTSIWTQRIGDTMSVRGYWKNGTVNTTNQASITLPTGYTIDSNKFASTASAQGIGTIWQVRTGTASVAAPWVVFYDGSTTGTVFICQNSGVNVFTNQSAGSLFSNSDGVSFLFSIPITNWES